MRDTILQFAKQFKFNPQIENKHNLSGGVTSYWVCGMGGSHLSADILRSWHPELPVRIHSDYGLPVATKDSLIIFSSYSGNTEEVIDGLNKAVSGGINCAVIASGGQLLDLAKKHKLPFVQLSAAGMQPRMALGQSLRALLALMGENQLLEETGLLGENLTPEALAGQGKEIADCLAERIPVVYASLANRAVAQIWKIKLNETAKIPAFYNYLPEVNHNEMEGFDLNNKSAPLSKNMHFVLIKDEDDDLRHTKRLEVMERMFNGRDLNVLEVEMNGESRIEKIFNSLLLADWIALHLAKYYGNDPEEVRMVEEFKKLIR